MPKVKTKYGKGYITRVLNSISESKLERIKCCVRIGYKPATIVREFNIPHNWAEILHDKYCLPDYSPPAVIGHKNEAYYSDEKLSMPVYKLEDLTGEEKLIAKKDTSTKLWTWEE